MGAQLLNLLIAGIVSATLAAGLAFWFNRQLARRGAMWQNKNDELNHISRVCEELFDIGVRYWSFAKDDGNRQEFEMYEVKMSAFVYEISSYMHEKRVMTAKLRQVIHQMSAFLSGEFGAPSRGADLDVAAAGAQGVLQVRRQFVFAEKGRVV